MTEWRCGKCGGLVNRPGQMGRSWCVVCDEYEIPVVEIENKEEDEYKYGAG